MSQGFFFAKYIGDKTGKGIDEDGGSEGAVGKNVVADGDFLVNELFADALVDAFIVTGDEDEVGFLGEFLGDGGFKGNAVWAEVDDF